MASNVSSDRPRISASAISSMMRPRSVAIVGVSAKPGSAGRVVLELLDNNKFTGPVHVVGRTAADIDGRKVLANVDELPQDVDLAVITLPAAAVREAVEGCVRRKVRTAVIFASGFAEVGSDGVSEQDRIGAIARVGGLALVGPNCLGFMNYVDGIAAVFFSPQADPSLAGRHQAPSPSSRKAAASAIIWRAAWPRAVFRSHAGFRPATRRASAWRTSSSICSTIR